MADHQPLVEESIIRDEDEMLFTRHEEILSEALEKQKRESNAKHSAEMEACTKACEEKLANEKAYFRELLEIEKQSSYPMFLVGAMTASLALIAMFIYLAKH